MWCSRSGHRTLAWCAEDSAVRVVGSSSRCTCWAQEAPGQGWGTEGHSEEATGPGFQMKTLSKFLLTSSIVFLVFAFSGPFRCQRLSALIGQLLVFLFSKICEPNWKGDSWFAVACCCLVCCVPLVSAKMSLVIPALSLFQETPPFTFHWLDFQVSRRPPLPLSFFPCCQLLLSLQGICSPTIIIPPPSGS